MTDMVKVQVTQDMLAALDAEDKRAEVIDGELIIGDHNVTGLHVIIINNLFRLLDDFVFRAKLGAVFSDGMRFILRSADDVERALIPDFSFVRAARVATEMRLLGDFSGAPDLVVEVASPAQSTLALIQRILMFLEAGSEEGWLIFQTKRELHRFRSDAAPEIYRVGDAFEAPTLFPGLSISVADIFSLERYGGHQA